MELPCDGDGACMSCKSTPTAEETLTCYTCTTPWHNSCLSAASRPATMADVATWLCPDCASPDASSAAAVVPSSDLVSAVRAIQADSSLSDAEKARRRQQLMSKTPDNDNDKETAASSSAYKNDLLDLIGTTLNCSICMQLPEKPVTTPCGHNFCLKCFEKWTGQGKRSCANCRSAIPQKVATNPRINSALVFAIRAARAAKASSHSGQPKAYHFVHNQNRPDTCFTTERAKKSGKANACSGKIFVTIPSDHFGPILADYDPQRGQGVLVGESWADRLECRQWGAHFPHVAGIAGQSKVGSQSVALSGGYEDDEDHGDWFLYTGSGGRDLSGNKRTNNTHSFDQKFEKLNQALRISCLKGYPVRVVRSHKEKRSAYAPETGVRYDGCYRIDKCWRKEGKQGFKMCRYLFVRCDNEPAPWTADDHGDRPRPLPVIKELKNAHDVTERKSDPHWDYDEEKECWCWKKAPPNSMKPVQTEHVEEDGSVVIKRRRAQTISARERLLKEFSCNICRQVMSLPITTPCAHNFCKACLDQVFAGQSLLKQRNCQGRRTLRAQKNIMKCPSCSIDIAEFLQNPQVNRELMNVIETLKQSEEDDNVDDAKQEAEVSDEDDKEGQEILDEPRKEEEEAKADPEVEVQKAATPKSAVKRASKDETKPVDEEAKADTEVDVQEAATPKSSTKKAAKRAGKEEMKPVDEEAKADTEIEAVDEKAPKESKGRQNQKRKKAAESSPSGTGGAMTRGKRAKAQ